MSRETIIFQQNQQIIIIHYHFNVKFHLLRLNMWRSYLKKF